MIVLVSQGIELRAAGLTGAGAAATLVSRSWVDNQEICGRKPVAKVLTENEVPGYRERGHRYPLDALSQAQVSD
jgi:hypothetical protein